MTLYEIARFTNKLAKCYVNQQKPDAGLKILQQFIFEYQDKKFE